MTTETSHADGVLRRTVLKATAVATGSLALMSPATASSDDASATVAVGSHPDLGDVLVGPDEMTLYMFEADEQGSDESACHDDCIEAWPPLSVEDEPAAGEGVTADLTTFEREDGETQVAAAGWPLYFFADDEEPGDANGQGVNDVWWVLDPDGTPVEEVPDVDEPEDVDEPDGFEVEVIAEHASFPDDVAATFDLTFADDYDEGNGDNYDNGDADDYGNSDGNSDGNDYGNGDSNDTSNGDENDDPISIELEDASTVIVAEATWTAGGTSGWHRHPGISIVNMVEGEIAVTMEHDCVPRTYAAGDAWLDPGHIHNADSDEGASAYVTFLGIPDGEPATEWVEPVDC